MSFLIRFCQGSWLIVIYWEWLVSIQVICSAKKRVWPCSDKALVRHALDVVGCYALSCYRVCDGISQQGWPSKFVALDSVIVNAEIAREYNKHDGLISARHIKPLDQARGVATILEGGGGAIVGSGQPTPHGRRKCGGTEGRRPLNLGGDVPLQILNEVAQIRRRFRFLGYFGGRLATCRRFVPPPTTKSVAIRAIPKIP